MTNGVGGSTAATELAKLTSQRDQTVAIGLDEYRQRIDKLCAVVLFNRTDDLQLRRIRRAPRGSRLHHRGGPAMVYRTEPLDG